MAGRRGPVRPETLDPLLQRVASAEALQGPCATAVRRVIE
ncbi:hypothetical protein APY03_1122 [Variovorax sp. WDL1]|nr:hypothetical protein APY03_1122 [Variovorax sp. WDL1]